MRASVIIPAFNAEATIGDAINSALMQTERSLEVLVANDRSEDATESVVRGISANDGRVRLLQNGGPRGPSSARNSAIKESSGEWLVILDADDKLGQGRISSLISEAESRKLDAITDNLEIVNARSSKSRGRAFPSDMLRREEPVDLRWLLEHDMPGSDFEPFGYSKPVMRKAALREAAITYDERFFMGEDFLLYGQMVLRGLRCGLSDSAGYLYSVGHDSLSGALKNSDQTIQVNRILLAEYSASPIGGDRTSVVRLFRQREAAFRYEDFAYAVKRRKMGAAVTASLQLSPGFTLRKIGRALHGRLNRN